MLGIVLVYKAYFTRVIKFTVSPSAARPTVPLSANYPLSDRIYNGCLFSLFCFLGRGTSVEVSTVVVAHGDRWCHIGAGLATM